MIMIMIIVIIIVIIALLLEPAHDVELGPRVKTWLEQTWMERKRCDLHLL